MLRHWKMSHTKNLLQKANVHHYKPLLVHSMNIHEKFYGFQKTRNEETHFRHHRRFAWAPLSPPMSVWPLGFMVSPSILLQNISNNSWTNLVSLSTCLFTFQTIRVQKALLKWTLRAAWTNIYKRKPNDKIVFHKKRCLTNLNEVSILCSCIKWMIINKS